MSSLEKFIILAQVRDVYLETGIPDKQIIVHAEPLTQITVGVHTTAHEPILTYFKEREEAAVYKHTDPLARAPQFGIVDTFEWYGLWPHVSSCLCGKADEYAKALDSPVSVFPHEFATFESYRKQLEEWLPMLRHAGGDIRRVFWYDRAIQEHRRMILEAVKYDKHVAKELKKTVHDKTKQAVACACELLPTTKELRDELYAVAILGDPELITNIFEQI